MSVYVEYVLIDNFIIDYLLLNATLVLTGGEKRKVRLVLCAILGAIISLLFPLFGEDNPIMPIIKILCGLTLVGFCRKHACFREFYIDCLVFLFLTFLLGGAIVGVFSILEIPTNTEVSIALMFLPVYILLRACMAVIKHFYRRKNVRALVYEVELVLGEVSIKTKGFLDTGNGLYIEGEPAIVCDKVIVQEFLEKALGKLKLKSTEITTVLSKEKSFYFVLDFIRIYYGDKPNIYNNVRCLVSKTKVGDEYQVILHPAFLEGNYVELNQTEIKKVS